MRTHKRYIRAIGVSHTACKNEFRQNLGSHSWMECNVILENNRADHQVPIERGTKGGGEGTRYQVSKEWLFDFPAGAPEIYGHQKNVSSVVVDSRAGVIVPRVGDAWLVGVGKRAPHGFRCLWLVSPHGSLDGLKAYSLFRLH